jgi:hypothetical protein
MWRDVKCAPAAKAWAGNMYNGTKSVDIVWLFVLSYYRSKRRRRRRRNNHVNYSIVDCIIIGRALAEIDTIDAIVDVNWVNGKQILQVSSTTFRRK